MNPSVNDPGEQATDKLLFQYLEGELTDEQTGTLDAQLAADPALRGELELWRAAFVTPEPCDTAALEKSLLKEPAAPAGAAGSLRRLGLVLVAAALFLSVPLLTGRLPGDKEPRPAAAKAGTLPRTTPAAKPPVHTPGRAPRPVPTPPDHGVAERAAPAGKLSRESHKDPAAAPAPLPAPVRMAAADRLEPVVTLQPVPAPAGTGLRYAAGLTVRKVKVPVTRTFSRKQQRAVARMKRRAIQQRKANEFLKGNVPYVVPLNPNSF
jgi:hypothetical protein